MAGVTNNGPGLPFSEVVLDVIQEGFCQVYFVEKRKKDNRESAWQSRAKKATPAFDEQLSRQVTVSSQVLGRIVECASRASRISAQLANKLAKFTTSHLEEYDINIQQLTIQNFLFMWKFFESYSQ
jgi:hypothetical protein